MNDAVQDNEVARYWLATLEVAGRAASTVRHHQRLVSVLFAYLQAEGGLSPSEVNFRSLVPVFAHGTLLGHGPINALFVERFLAWACRDIPERERAAKHRNDLLETLHLFFRSLVAADKLGEDPTPRVPRAKTRVWVNHRKYLTPVESGSLLDAAAISGEHAPRDFTLVLLLMRAGLRPGEACGLRTSDVDLENGHVHVTGKTGPRTTALVPAAHEVLKRYLRSSYLSSRQLLGGPLFPNDTGTGPLDTNGLNKLIRRLCDLAGIDRAVTTYWLRHTFATDAHRSGVEFPIISQALGHSKITSTYTYVHGRESRMRRIVERGPAAIPFVDAQRALMRAVKRPSPMPVTRVQ